MKKTIYSSRNPIPEAVLDKFRRKLRTLIKNHFGTDFDPDCPIDVNVVDRTRCEPDHYVTVPYTHGAKWDGEKIDLNDVIDQMIRLTINVNQANDAMRRFATLVQHWRSESRIVGSQSLNGARNGAKGK